MATINKTTTESNQQTQIVSFTITGLKVLNKATINTGDIEIVSVVDELVTVKCKNGAYTSRKLISGSYTASDTKTVSDSRISSTDSFSSTISYNSGGYSGTLSKSGSSSSRVVSGSYTPADSKIVTGQTSANYDSGGYKGTLTQYVYSGEYIPYGPPLEVGAESPTGYDSISSIPSTFYYNGYAGAATGYKGTISFWGYTERNGKYYGMYKGTLTRPESDTRVYRYQGTVTKPASDTRVYEYTQNYSGSVTKPASDTRVYENNYSYTISFVYNSNSIPTEPTLDVPATQFEHGDKHYISYNSSDNDGDPVTFLLEATYDNEVTWIKLYDGPLKTYQYTVPSDKTQVKFRVRATDGKDVTGYTKSVSKSIREVYYYWSRYNNTLINNPSYSGEYYLSVTTNAFDSSVSYIVIDGIQYDFKGVNYEREIILGRGYTSVFWGGSAYVGQNYVSDGYTSSTFYMPFTHSISTHKGTVSYVGYVIYEGNSIGGYRTFSHYVRERTGSTTSDSRGSLIINSLQAGFNAYKIGMKNSDGYWYERGQRVLNSDITPPVIELTEQDGYATTSTVTVKTYDLSTVTQIKYSEGDKDIAFFKTSGTDITSSKKFTVSENGVCTVYAKDSNNNEIVQKITIYKVNKVPTLELKDMNDLIISNNSSVTIKNPYNGYSFKVIGNDEDARDNVWYRVSVDNSDFISPSPLEKLKGTVVNIPQNKIGFSTSLVTVEIKDSKEASVQRSFTIVNKAPESHSNKHVYEYIIKLI